MKKILAKKINKEYTKEFLKTQKCCFCCSVGGGIGYIAFWVILRALGLIVTSFVPPLIRIELEDSFMYPGGHSYITFYFENSLLTALFTLNILCTFFMLCYGVSSYYTWILSQSDMVDMNRMDPDIYEKLPKSHYGFILYLFAQGGIVLAIHYMDLPKNLIVFKPPYYSLGGALIFEIFLVYIVKWYVRISLDRIKKIIPNFAVEPKSTTASNASKKSEGKNKKLDKKE